ncbi:hypothetical protein [Pseudobacteriovorax antillogorgiicola]|uniref:Uncharacterized protein n=1 Tax=Pseudobacteriovorax antillogorgiicola TaxID=1513793 RepID=A0A1Y6BN74_9BACT|nr:hypothetical protein [Pseudobacteriovorax antillogorgiicola]TCS54559.1 hypothetical protein EDD56_10672 [Pseudobacteriovorax antillogorgiicola]SMF18279.1 hypothetical protein SAMN06296036_106171 [Pseudobacteriovorax antillogorgiicola]
MDSELINDTHLLHGSQSCQALATSMPETAIEIEVLRRAKLTNLIAPSNGLLSGLYPKENIPGFLLDRYGDKDTILQLPWVNLDLDEKNRILDDLSSRVDFDKDRRLPGFVARRHFEIKARKDFVFLGVKYRKGRSYTLNLEGFLQDLVEYSSSSRVKGAIGIEFHFRSKLPFLEFRREIDIFFKSVVPSIEGESKLVPDGIHLHIPAVLPMKYFARLRKQGYSGEEAAVALTFYVQMAELCLIIDNARSYGIGLDTIPHKLPSKPPMIDFLSKDKIEKTYHYFLDIYQGKEPKLRGTLKKNNVGVRSGDIYDQPSLWGLELRFNHFDTTRKQCYGDLADSIRRTMHQQTFAVPMDAVQGFVKNHGQNIGAGLKKHWFRGPIIKQIQENLDNVALAKLMLVYLKNKKIQDFPFIVGGFQPSAQILFMDWSKHPIFSALGDCERIVATQAEHLERAILQKDYTISDMAAFFTSSGIAQVTRNILYPTPFT